MHVRTRVRSFHRRRLVRGAALIVAVVASMAMSECPVSPDAANCGDLASDAWASSSPNLQQTDNAYRDGGQAHFDWGHDISGMCVESPESDNKATFQVNLTSVTPDVNLEGRVYHAAFIQPYKTILRVSSNATTFSGTVEDIGLRQGNPNGSPASVSLELHLSFNSSGNIDADAAKARELVAGFTVFTDYRKATK
jgi:hypothetical protein